MKAQENVKTDNISIQSDTLSDLPVAEEQADETTAGTGSRYDGQIQVLSWSWGASNAGSFEPGK